MAMHMSQLELILDQMQEGTVLTSPKNGRHYERLMDGTWVCQETAETFSCYDLSREEDELE